MNHVFIAAVAAVVLMQAQAINACDAHLIPVNPTVLDGEKNSSLSLNGQYSKYDPPKSGGHAFENLTTTLTISQQVSGRSSIQLGLPYIDRTLDDTSESGIGDIALIGVYRVFEKQQDASGVFVDVYGGIEMPTGDTDPLQEEKAVAESEEHAEEHSEHAGETPAVPHHSEGHHLALGSGSWDGIFGAVVRANRDAWSTSFDLQYILRTEGDYDFEYGDEYYVRGGVYRGFAAGTGTVQAGVIASGEWSDENSVNGETSEGSDKAAGYAGPVISYVTAAAFNLSLAYDFPVYNTDDGLEGSADYRVRASLSYLF